MTTCTTTATIIITIYDTHGVVCCSWQNGALWKERYLLPVDSILIGERIYCMCSCHVAYAAYVLVSGLILRLDVSKTIICCWRTRVYLGMKRLDRLTEPRMRWCYFVLDAGRLVRPKEGHLRILIAACYFYSQHFLLIDMYLFCLIARLLS